MKDVIGMIPEYRNISRSFNEMIGSATSVSKTIRFRLELDEAHWKEADHPENQPEYLTIENSCDKLSKLDRRSHYYSSEKTGLEIDSL